MKAEDLLFILYIRLNRKTQGRGTHYCRLHGLYLLFFLNVFSTMMMMCIGVLQILAGLQDIHTLFTDRFWQEQLH